MLSPARRHVETAMARRANSSGNARPGFAPPMPTSGAAAQEYRLLLVALGEDLRALHNIQSLEAKIARKRDLIPRFMPWLEGALAGADAAQDIIVVTMLVWSIDVGDWPLALRLAEHVIAHRLDLPERYKRTPGCLIAEEFAEAGLKLTPMIDRATLTQAHRLTEGQDMPDEVRAKLLKAIGIAFKAEFDAFDPDSEVAIAGQRPALAERALAHFTRALELDPKSGVKKLIEQLERALKKLPDGETA